MILFIWSVFGFMLVVSLMAMEAWDDYEYRVLEEESSTNGSS